MEVPIYQSVTENVHHDGTLGPEHLAKRNYLLINQEADRKENWERPYSVLQGPVLIELFPQEKHPVSHAFNM